MNKHTSGPWMVVEDGLSAEVNIVNQDRLDKGLVSIAEMNLIFDGFIGEEQQANARLIAAAPELLEALEDLIYADKQNTGHEPSLSYFQRSISEAEAVIAKAKGEL